jgi:serine/threonine protein kinase
MRHIAGYEILEPLGQGGCGSTYKARDPNSGRLVVLESLPFHYTVAQGDAAHVKAEAEALAQLDHPNVIRFLGVVEDSGQPYAVFEYVEGRSLALELRSRPLPPNEAAAVVEGVARAVQAAHEVGLLHRDLKPAHVLLGSDGRPRLREFMLPARHEAVRQMTESGTFQGTPAYVAPEQARGDPRQLGPATDVYGLGAILYETLTGRPPFQGSTPMETLTQVMTKEPDPPSQVNDAVPRDMDRIVLKCLQKDPRQRYASAAELLQDLQRFVRGDPVMASPPRPRTRGGFAPPRPAGTPAPATPEDSLIRLERCHKPAVLAPQKTGSPELPGITTDAVVFTVTSPPTLVPGSAAVIDVWAHLERQRQEMLDRARAEAGGDVRSKSKGAVEVARGSTLSVKLQVQDLVIDDPEDTILWQGEIGNATFAVRVPSQLTPGTRTGVASIFVGGLRIARLNFVVQVGPEPKNAEPLPTREERHRKAFASYASPDRDEVLGRIQGIQKAAPGLEVFLDVVRLRSGQHWEGELYQRIGESDIFYLFWSANARKSEWVEKEWRYALQTRGLDFIDPVPLVPPDEVPPPTELAEKHFNDWVLAFRRNRRREAFFASILKRLGLR